MPKSIILPFYLCAYKHVNETAFYLFQRQHTPRFCNTLLSTKLYLRVEYISCDGVLYSRPPSTENTAIQMEEGGINGSIVFLDSIYDTFIFYQPTSL